MQHLVRLGLDRLDDLGNRVARSGGEDPGEEVEILVPVDIPDLQALAVVERYRLLVEESDPVGHHLAVSGEKRLRIGHRSS